MPVRSGIAQAADDERQARGGNRRVERHDGVDEAVEPQPPRRGAFGAGTVCLRRVDADAALAPAHAKQALVVHQLEHVRRRARGSAPVVGDRAVREVRVDLARMHRAALAHELEDRPGALVGGGRRDRRARMHQRLHAPGHEAVVDEEILFDRQRLVARLEVAGAVALDARPQRQVLGAGRGSDGIGLHEAQPIERAFERRRRKQAAADGEAPQILECAHHAKTLLSSDEGHGTGCRELGRSLARRSQWRRRRCPADFQIRRRARHD